MQVIATKCRDFVYSDDGASDNASALSGRTDQFAPMKVHDRIEKNIDGEFVIVAFNYYTD